MDYLRLFIVFFVLGTWVLVKLNVKRYFIIFLIKTRRGVDLIEKIAKLSPSFWKFVADFAVIVSFGGLGAAYLAKHRQRRSLFATEIMLASFVLFFVLVKYGVFYSALAGVFLLAALISFYKAGSQLIDFLSTATFIYLIGASFFMSFGVSLHVVNVLLLASSVFGLPAIVLLGLWMNASDIISKSSVVPGVSPLLPSSRGGNLGVSFPGYDIFIPWWYALIALVITIVFHELAHGILAKAHGMKIKSTGLITVGILPIGAFVEPDEEEVKGRPSIQRMRLFSVGSFSNLCVCVFAGMFYVSLVALIAVLMKADGLEIVSTVKGYPADGVLAPGTVLYEVNGKPVDQYDFFPGVKPGEEVYLKTDREVVKLRTVESPDNKSRAYIGVYSAQRIVLKDGFKRRFQWIPSTDSSIKAYIAAILFMLSSLKWIMFFNFNIALVNLVPIAPFDGWHTLKELLSAFNISEASAQRIAYGVLAFAVILFLINISPIGTKAVSYFI